MAYYPQSDWISHRHHSLWWCWQRQRLPINKMCFGITNSTTATMTQPAATPHRISIIDTTAAIRLKSPKLNYSSATVVYPLEAFTSFLFPSAFSFNFYFKFSAYCSLFLHCILNIQYEIHIITLTFVFKLYRHFFDKWWNVVKKFRNCGEKVKKKKCQQMEINRSHQMIKWSFYLFSKNIIKTYIICLGIDSFITYKKKGNFDACK